MSETPDYALGPEGVYLLSMQQIVLSYIRKTATKIVELSIQVFCTKCSTIGKIQPLSDIHRVDCGYFFHV